MKRREKTIGEVLFSDANYLVNRLPGCVSQPFSKYRPENLPSSQVHHLPTYRQKEENISVDEDHWQACAALAFIYFFTLSLKKEK